MDRETFYKNCAELEELYRKHRISEYQYNEALKHYQHLRELSNETKTKTNNVSSS